MNGAMSAAAKVSAEAFNERGGIAGRCIKMLTCDDGADPNQAADCARTHVKEGVVAEINDSVVAAADVVLDIFTQAGIPSGGLFTGADEIKTRAQAELWGGEADESFDPNYHKSSDSVDNVDPAALDVNGRGVAYVIGLYAQDLNGRNGVPVRADRTRHTISRN